MATIELNLSLRSLQIHPKQRNGTLIRWQGCLQGKAVTTVSLARYYKAPCKQASKEGRVGVGHGGLQEILQLRCPSPCLVRFIWPALQNSSKTALLTLSPDQGLCQSKVRPKEEGVLQRLSPEFQENPSGRHQATCHRNLASWPWERSQTALPENPANS